MSNLDWETMVVILVTILITKPLMYSKKGGQVGGHEQGGLAQQVLHTYTPQHFRRKINLKMYKLLLLSFFPIRRQHLAGNM